MWRRLGDDFAADWLRVRPLVVSGVSRGRTATVAAALPYTAAVLAETGQDAPPTGRLNPDRFAETAPDGRPVGLVLDGAVITARQQIAQGAPVSTALQAGGDRLSREVLTMLADTRRQVYHADIIQRPKLTGYVRMLNAPSCSRCVILAGKHFSWNTGFQRHPRCDCIHIPASESVGADMSVDPYAYFESLSAKDQERTFTKSGARAIRDGADIGRVVNLRGMQTAIPKGRKRANARLTVDDIYRVAGTRTNAIRLLEQEGYILPSILTSR